MTAKTFNGLFHGPVATIKWEDKELKATADSGEAIGSSRQYLDSIIAYLWGAWEAADWRGFRHSIRHLN